jgi:hypothetical protein
MFANIMKQVFIAIAAVAFCARSVSVSGQIMKPAIINATGGTGTANGKHFDYSIGEMTMVSTCSGAGLIVTQGLLQTNLFPDLGLSNIRYADAIRVFPNPASTVLNIRYTAAAAGRLNCRLMDMAGRLVMDRTDQIIQGVNMEELDVSEIAAAPYMLEVSFVANGGSKSINSFKIDKLK